MNFLDLMESAENNKKMILTSAESKVFPAQDVIDFKPVFMSLKGVDSPLSEYIVQNENLSNILDKINHKIYFLLYLAMKKYFNKLIGLNFKYSRENLYKNIKKYLGESIKFEITEFVLSKHETNNAVMRVGEYGLNNKLFSKMNRMVLKIGPVLLSQARQIREDKKFKKIILDNVGSNNTCKIQFEIMLSCANHVVIGQWILH